MPAELILRNYIITSQLAARPNRGAKRRSNGGTWDFEDGGWVLPRPLFRRFGITLSPSRNGTLPPNGREKLASSGFKKVTKVLLYWFVKFSTLEITFVFFKRVV